MCQNNHFNWITEGIFEVRVCYSWLEAKKSTNTNAAAFIVTLRVDVWIHSSLAALATDICTLYLKDRREYKVTRSVFLPEIVN